MYCSLGWNIRKKLHNMRLTSKPEQNVSVKQRTKQTLKPTFFLVLITNSSIFDIQGVSGVNTQT